MLAFQMLKNYFEQHKKTSVPSYAAVVGSSSEKDDCNTCKILGKILLQKFPDVATELKELLPASTLSKLIPDSSSTSKTNKLFFCTVKTYKPPKYFFTKNFKAIYLFTKYPSTKNFETIPLFTTETSNFILTVFY